MVLQKYNTGHMTAGASLGNFKLWVQLFTFSFDMWVGVKPIISFKKLGCYMMDPKNIGCYCTHCTHFNDAPVHDNSSYRILKAK